MLFFGRTIARSYKLQIAFRLSEKVSRAELRMLDDKETRAWGGRKKRYCEKGSGDEGGPREICKADFRIGHTLLRVSRGCWIVRAGTTNAKRKYFFLFVYRSIALLNWLVRKHLHTRDLDFIPSSYNCVFMAVQTHAQSSAILS